MKIIKHGTIPQDKVYRGTCAICRTEFEFARKEAKREVADQRDGDAMVVACPVCGRECWINI